MKIIQHGRSKPKFSTIKRFKCDSCGCVFETDKDEYSKCTIFDEQMQVCRYKCLCPECHSVADEVIMRGNV